MKTKTKLQIIDETVKYYSKDTSRRATTDNNGCAYYIKAPHKGKDRMCAVGRCITKRAMESKVKECNGYLAGLICEAGPLDEILKPSYRGHSDDFWTHLQAIHDGKKFWDKEGLTEEGEIEVKFIKEKYKS